MVNGHAQAEGGGFGFVGPEDVTQLGQQAARGLYGVLHGVGWAEFAWIARSAGQTWVGCVGAVVAVRGPAQKQRVALDVLQGAPLTPCMGFGQRSDGMNERQCFEAANACTPPLQATNANGQDDAGVAAAQAFATGVLVGDFARQVAGQKAFEVVRELVGAPTLGVHLKCGQQGHHHAQRQRRGGNRQHVSLRPQATTQHGHQQGHTQKNEARSKERAALTQLSLAKQQHQSGQAANQDDIGPANGGDNDPVVIERGRQDFGMDADAGGIGVKGGAGGVDQPQGGGPNHDHFALDVAGVKGAVEQFEGADGGPVRMGPGVGHHDARLRVEGKAHGTAAEPLSRAHEAAARAELPASLGVKRFGGFEGELRVACVALAQHCGQTSQGTVGVRRGAEVPGPSCWQAVCNAEITVKRGALGAQVRQVVGGAKTANLWRVLDLRVHDGHLPKDDVTPVAQGLVKGDISRGGFRQKDVPGLNKGPPFTQAGGHVSQHGAGPRPGADLGQAGLIDVNQDNVLRGRFGRRQAAGDEVMQLRINGREATPTCGHDTE